MEHVFLKNIDNAYKEVLNVIKAYPSGVLLKDAPGISQILESNFPSVSDINDHLKNYYYVILKEKPNQEIGSSIFWLYRGAIRVLITRTTLIPSNFCSGNFTSYVEKILEYLYYPGIGQYLAHEVCIKAVEFCRKIDSSHSRDEAWIVMERCYSNTIKKLVIGRTIEFSEFYRLFCNELLKSLAKSAQFGKNDL
jgi:hypothetical protein